MRKNHVRGKITIKTGTGPEKLSLAGTFTGRENYLKYSWFYLIKSAVLGLVFTSRKRPWLLDAIKIDIIQKPKTLAKS